jgi:hypothetical protein
LEAISRICRSSGAWKLFSRYLQIFRAYGADNTGLQIYRARSSITAAFVPALGYDLARFQDKIRTSGKMPEARWFALPPITAAFVPTSGLYDWRGSKTKSELPARCR